MQQRDGSWLPMNQRVFSRRRLLRSAAIGGIGVAGLALVGCDDGTQDGQTASQGDVDGTSKKGGTLTVGLEADPGTLDPAGTTGRFALLVSGLIHETLTQEVLTDPAIPVEPSLAESWEVSQDQLAWTFTLRPNVRFHDGTAFDAEAVRANFDRTREGTPFYSARARTNTNWLWGLVKDVVVLDPTHVRLELKEPYFELPRALASPNFGFVSPTRLQQVGTDGYASQPSGTGPFRLKQFQVGQQAVLERNPEYWGEAPYLDSIVFRTILESATRTSALETGEVLLANYVTPDDVERLRGNSDVQLLETGAPRVDYWTLNCKDGPTADRRVRQAINYAVDKEAIAGGLLKRTARPAQGPVAFGNPIYDEEYDPYPYTPDKARDLLREAGLPDGFRGRVLVFEQDYQASMAQLVQANLRDVGIDVEIQVLEFNAWLDRVSKGLPSDTMAFQSSFSQPTVLFGLERLYSTANLAPAGTNRGWYSNPEADRLFQAVRTAKDDEEFVNFGRELGRTIGEDAPYLWLINPRMYRGASKRVKGLVSVPSDRLPLASISLDG